MRRCEDLFRETESRVRIGGELNEIFWTNKEVRQRCLTSLRLFNINNGFSEILEEE